MSGSPKSASGWRGIAGLITWGATVLASLRLQELPFDFGHGICGPWGCGPPVQVLAACHAFWIVNLAALLWMAHRWLPIPWERRVAGFSVTIGLVGLIAVAGQEALIWWPQASEWSRAYVVQRYLFSVATLVDVPLVELVLFGLVAQILVRRRTDVPRESDEHSNAS